jgi:cell division protein ZapA
MDDGGGMAQVNVIINGKQFRMACEDGQEDHLLQLAEEFDGRISELRKKFGEVGDTRLTIMAALIVADELAEANKKVRQHEASLAALENGRRIAADRAQMTQAAIVSALNSAAERIEGITKKLNQTPGGNGVALG